jgi:hypothetical protein
LNHKGTKEKQRYFAFGSKMLKQKPKNTLANFVPLSFKNAKPTAKTP